MSTPFESELDANALQPVPQDDFIAPVIPLFPEHNVDGLSGTYSISFPRTDTQVHLEKHESHEISEDITIAPEKLKLGDRFRNKCIGTALIYDTAWGDLNNGLEAANGIRQKADVVGTTLFVLAGQAYERARIPDVVGTSLTVNAYKEVLERGWNSGLATAAGALTLGVTVYLQQKPIGLNVVHAIDKYPDTSEAVNEYWPKAQAAAKAVTPDPDHRYAEGGLMFGVGTTPLVISAKLSNPSISHEELRSIERRVTRRGSVYAAGFAGTLLGIKSGATLLPEKVRGFALREDMVNWSSNLVNWASKPHILVPTIMAGVGLGKLKQRYSARKSVPENA